MPPNIIYYCKIFDNLALHFIIKQKMNILKKGFAVVLCLLLGNILMAQPANDWMLANQYFNAGEYEKALVYFEKRYDFDPMGSYEGYLKCFIALRQYSEAEKLIKKHIKKSDNDAPLYVDWGSLYEIQLDDAKAKEYYDKAIKELRNDQNSYITLAQKFIEKGHVDKAVSTYLSGRKNMKGAYPFIFELADAYGQLQESDKMIEEYLSIPEVAPEYIPNLQTILQNKLNTDFEGALADKLRSGLLKKIQQNPDEPTLNNLLYWLLVQEKDFDTALMQAKALDKRFDRNGQRIMSLGTLCISNQIYSTAEDCFQYLIDNYKENRGIYTHARQQQIYALDMRITSQNNYTPADLTKLSNAYDEAISELGTNATTADLMRGRAHLKAFYLHQIDEADSLLEVLITIPSITPEDLAQIKLELGDILVLKNEVWDALLYYGQVDKDFKHDELGREAKFRVARVYYYEGQFDWASGQLNVLKAATTQLISNDAMSLALLIQDNITVDTNPIPLLIYSKADLLAFQNKGDEAIVLLDSLAKEFPGHSLSDDLYFKKAEIYAKRSDYDNALKLYNEVTLHYGDDVLADDSQFRIADILENIKKDKPAAMAAYELMLQHYPGSLFIMEARKRFRALRGDKIN